MKALALAACLMLTGCETISYTVRRVPDFIMSLNKPAEVPGSYSAELSIQDSERVARDMVRFLSNQFPYARTTIRLDPIKSDFHDAFVQSLMRQGFGVVEHGGIPDAVVLHYAVTLFPSGVIGRMSFQGREVTRFYARSANGLSINSAYAMRGVVKK
jgi:hypothetical protein